MTDLLFNGPRTARATLILAHGAGAPMDSPFMEVMADGLAGLGWRVARFEFPYMAARRTGERRPPPNRQPVLLETWLDVIGHVRKTAAGARATFIGGKSMGGRMASLVADEAAAAGLVCLGYPFHPPGKPERLRTEHLADLRTPTLILQGERDTFGTREEVPGYDLSRKIAVTWLPDGDHSLKPRKSSGHTEAENLAAAVTAIDRFMDRHAARRDARPK